MFDNSRLDFLAFTPKMPPTNRFIAGAGLCFIAVVSLFATSNVSAQSIDPMGPGPFPVASTNFEVQDAFSDLPPREMKKYLIGSIKPDGETRYISQILKHPQATNTIELTLPKDPTTYGAAAGSSIPLSYFVTYPTNKNNKWPSYKFPYSSWLNNTFTRMQPSDKAPQISEEQETYPLIILSHGYRAHGLYDIDHAEKLASHGYIVVTLFHGDERIVSKEDNRSLLMYMRPFETTSVLDTLLEHPQFKDRINHERIGISGHSMGGFTVFASMGAPFLENSACAQDERFTAGVAASPYMGGIINGKVFHPFGPANRALKKFTKPVLTLFANKDRVTQAKYIVPAVEKKNGPSYLVELVDQRHIYERGSWADRNQWELFFFKAYLQDDAAALQTLKTAESIDGGNIDKQRFEYQKLP